MLNNISKYLSKLSNFFLESSSRIDKLDSEIKSEISKEKFKFGLYGFIIGLIVGFSLRAF